MEKRETRYRQKSEFIVDQVALFNFAPKSRDQIDALLHRVHVAIDAAMDIIAMLVKDFGFSVSDDYHNIALLAEHDKIDASLGQRLRRLNGLRNAIIHKYNSFEEHIVIKNVGTIKSTLITLIKTADGHTKTLFRKNKK